MLELSVRMREGLLQVPEGGAVDPQLAVLQMEDNYGEISSKKSL